MHNNGFVALEDILSNDILNSSLAPAIGEEDISLNITPSSGAFTDPFSQELELIKPIELVEDSQQQSYNSSPININNINTNQFIDPLTGNNNNRNSNNDTFTGFKTNSLAASVDISSLEFQGGFGDYNGGNDTSLEIKDAEGKVVEIFSLTGEREGTVYKDDEFEYIFFSGTDETTDVNITAINNLKLDNYFGDSLKVETEGSITARDIALENEDETGLVLRSGVREGESAGVEGYSLVDLGLGKAYDINNLGEVVGETNERKGFLYSDNKMLDLESFIPYGINNLGEVVGGSSNNGAFLYSDGQIINLDIPSLKW